MNVLSRAVRPAVALETTLPVHGVPRDRAHALAANLRRAVRESHANPAFVGVVSGVPTVGMSDAEIDTFLGLPARDVAKANTANLGLVLHARGHGATTVSTTVELAAAAGVRVAATGGLGGVHRNLARRPDFSADLPALARHPVAIVTSGVKALLDVEATRELLETLGIPVVGVGTDCFPAFYLRESGATVDARIDNPRDIAAFARAETLRTGRAVVVANPVPTSHAIPPADWDRWLAAALAEADAQGISGRGLTPFVLETLHRLSGGRTLEANVALAVANARLAGAIAAAWSGTGPANEP